MPESRELKFFTPFILFGRATITQDNFHLNPPGKVEVMQFDFEVSGARRAFPGHFPGAPVVPAVVLIEYMTRGLEQTTGKPVTNIRQLRLLSLIAPDKRVDVECQEKTPDSWRLTCTVAGEPVAKAIFSSEQLQTGTDRHLQCDQPRYQSAQAVYDRLPHADAMQLIEKFALIDNGAQTRATITNNHPLADTHGLPAWAALEYAAQLMACRKLSMGGEPMSRAVIVLVRALRRYTVESMPAEGELMVEVTERVAQPGAVQCAFTAAYGEERIAAGEFTVVSGV